MKSLLMRMITWKLMRFVCCILLTVCFMSDCFQGLLDDDEPSMDDAKTMPSLEKVMLQCLFYVFDCVLQVSDSDHTVTVTEETTPIKKVSVVLVYCVLVVCLCVVCAEQ